MSKLLFGRPCRLPVAAWVLQHDKRFIQSRPPTFATTSASNVREELSRLVDLGMLVRDEPGDGRVYYEKLDHPLWQVIAAAATATGLAWEEDRLVERYATDPGSHSS